MLLNRFNYYLYMLYTCKAHLKICDSRLRGNKLINVKMLNVNKKCSVLLKNSVPFWLDLTLWLNELHV